MDYVKVSSPFGSDLKPFELTEIRLDSWGIGLEGAEMVTACLRDASNEITWLK